MLKRLLKAFGKEIAGEAAAETVNAFGEEHIAVAVLLIEAAKLDGTFSDEERTAITSLLGARFSLDTQVVTDLFTSADEQHEQSVEIFRFTNTVKSNFSEEERVQMIEMLWQVAYSDGEVHDYEANLLRRVSGLLHIPDRAAGDARKRVIAGLTDDETEK